MTCSSSPQRKLAKISLGVVTAVLTERRHRPRRVRRPVVEKIPRQPLLGCEPCVRTSGVPGVVKASRAPNHKRRAVSKLFDSAGSTLVRSGEICKTQDQTPLEWTPAEWNIKNACHEYGNILKLSPVTANTFFFCRPNFVRAIIRRDFVECVVVADWGAVLCLASSISCFSGAG